MDSVTVVFGNGNVVQFYAEEFDVNLVMDPSRVNKYAYKDARGQDSAVYLKPNQVAGVFLTKAADTMEPPIVYKVPGLAPSS